MSATPKHIDLDNAEFQHAWQLIQNTSQSVFLTGKAGTGKSTFLRYITENTHKQYVVLAPTGVAAVNAGGQTLHSFFKLPLKPFAPDDPEFSENRIKDRLKYNAQLIKLIRSLDLIIIDEISMVRVDVIDLIDRILRVYTGMKRLPFGGKQLLLVGDVFQLEPVITADTREIILQYYPNGYFFSANAFKHFPLVPIELRKVYRQSDDDFISLLDRIRQGRPLQSDIHTLNARWQQDAAHADTDPNGLAMTIASRRDSVDAINERRLAALPSAEYTYEGEVTGEFPESSYPTDLNLKLKVGAQVVFIKNEPEQRWVNGTLAKVIRTGTEVIEVELENGEQYTLERERWSNVKYTLDPKTHKVVEEEKGSFSQYPIKLAWALTIHKSQGLTFDRVIIDMGRGAFAGGQSYVALSRCRSLEGITLNTSLNENDVWVNRDVMAFARRFNDDRLISDSLRNARARKLLESADSLVRRRELPQAVDALLEGLNIDPSPLQDPRVRRLIRGRLSYVGRLQNRIRLLEAEVDSQNELLEECARYFVRQANESGDPEEALNLSRRATKLAPLMGAAWLALGQATAAVGDPETALQHLRYATKIMPTDWQAPRHAASIALSMGLLTDALDLLLAAIDRNPEIPELFDSAAEIYELVNDKKSAASFRKTAKALRKKK